jgi:hypothetical protein
VTLAPETVGAGAPTPSISASSMPARFSLPTTRREPAEETVAPSAGIEEEKAGTVLSTRRSATAAEVVELPAASVTTTRKS